MPIPTGTSAVDATAASLARPALAHEVYKHKEHAALHERLADVAA